MTDHLTEVINATMSIKELCDVILYQQKEISKYKSIIEEYEFLKNVERGNIEIEEVNKFLQDKKTQLENLNETYEQKKIRLEELNKQERKLDMTLDRLVDEGFQLSKKKDELEKKLSLYNVDEKKTSKEEKEKKKQETKDRAKELVKCDTCDIEIRRDGVSRHLKSKAHLKNI